MWFAIITFIIVIIIWFLHDRQKMIRKLKEEGGVRNKYEILIKSMLAEHPYSKIFNQNTSFLDLGVSSFGITKLYRLLMTFSTITITYNIKSEIVGNHSLSWEFRKDDDQEFMYHVIAQDIVKYYENNADKIEKNIIEKTLKYINKEIDECQSNK